MPNYPVHTIDSAPFPSRSPPFRYSLQRRCRSELRAVAATKGYQPSLTCWRVRLPSFVHLTCMNLTTLPMGSTFEEEIHLVSP